MSDDAEPSRRLIFDLPSGASTSNFLELTSTPDFRHSLAYRSHRMTLPPLAPVPIDNATPSTSGTLSRCLEHTLGRSAPSTFGHAKQPIPSLLHEREAITSLDASRKCPVLDPGA